MVGNECARTHRLIDSYSSILGKKHRTFYHDPISAMIVADVLYAYGEIGARSVQPQFFHQKAVEIHDFDAFAPKLVLSRLNFHRLRPRFNDRL